MRGKKHSDETRALVVADLLSGLGVMKVASKYNLDPSVVSRIRSSLGAGELQEIASLKRESLATLIENHLRASLKAAMQLAGQCDDETWRNKQNAADMAIFYGVLTDKSIKIVEAAENASLNDIQRDEKVIPAELIS